MRRMAALLVSAILVIEGSAYADTDPESKAAAEVLFRAGTAAFDAGDYADACEKLEGAVALTHGEALGGLFFLARCYVKLGKRASAFGLFNEVATRARAAGQTERAEDARKAVLALKPELRYIALRLAPALAATPGLQITRQNKPIPRELWTNPFPVDPGPTAIVTSAPGKRTSTKGVDIPATPGEMWIDLGPLEDEPRPQSQSLRIATAPAAVPRPRTWGGLKIAGAVAAGLGVVGMAASVVIGAVAKGRYDAATSDTTNCAPRPGGGFTCADPRPADRARALGDVGTGTFIAGAGVLAGGALTFVLAPRAGSTHVALAWTRALP